MSDIIPKLLSCCNKQIHGDCRTLACRRPDGSFSCTENIAAAELTRLRTANAALRAVLTRIDGIVWEPGQEGNREIQILNLQQITRLQRGNSTPGVMEGA